jgi:hypothetical protein
MFYLISKESNKTVLRLRELASLQAPFYVFQFTQELTRKEYIFAPENLSTNPNFDLFEFDLTDSDMSNGEYWCGIYESAEPTESVEGLGEPICIERCVVGKDIFNTFVKIL